MSDLAVRLMLVGGAAAIALAVAFAAHRAERRRARRAPLDLTDVDARVVFFTDVTCVRCDVVRDRLDEAGIDYREIAYDRQPEAHRRAGVTGVPLIVIRDEQGNETARLAGVVSTRKIKTAVG